MLKIITLIMLLWCGAANAEPELTLYGQHTRLDAVDTVMVANAVKLLADDWGQTTDLVANHRLNRYETNGLLGRHPSRDRVNGYFALATVGAVALATRIEDPYLRRGFLAAVMMLEALMIQNNTQLGIHSEFAEDRRRPIVVSMTFPLE